MHATKRLMGLPSYFNVPIVERINLLYGDNPGGNSHALWPDRGAKVQLEAFKQYWDNEVAPYDRVERFFRAIAQPGKQYIVKDDFLLFSESSFTSTLGSTFWRPTRTSSRSTRSQSLRASSMRSTQAARGG